MRPADVRTFAEGNFAKRLSFRDLAALLLGGSTPGVFSGINQVPTSVVMRCLALQTSVEWRMHSPGEPARKTARVSEVDIDMAYVSGMYLLSSLAKAALADVVPDPVLLPRAVPKVEPSGLVIRPIDLPALAPVRDMLGT